jgi:hypothetical protein
VIFFRMRPRVQFGLATPGLVSEMTQGLLVATRLLSIYNNEYLILASTKHIIILFHDNYYLHFFINIINNNMKRKHLIFIINFERLIYFNNGSVFKQLY